MHCTLKTICPWVGGSFCRSVPLLSQPGVVNYTVRCWLLTLDWTGLDSFIIKDDNGTCFPSRPFRRFSRSLAEWAIRWWSIRLATGLLHRPSIRPPSTKLKNKHSWFFVFTLIFNYFRVESLMNSGLLAYEYSAKVSVVPLLLSFARQIHYAL